MKRMAIGLLGSALVVGALPAASAAEITWEIRNKGGKVAATELALQGLPTSENPFDPNYADVIAKVTDPSGHSFSIPMYWYQGYEIVASYNQLSNRKVGNPEWRLKFRPTALGDFRIQVNAKINGQDIQVPQFTFAALEKAPEPIKIRGRNFVQGEEIFIPFAYNIAWANRYEEISKYERWFKSASANGFNK